MIWVFTGFAFIIVTVIFAIRLSEDPYSRIGRE